ncbi:MAG: hypothetical protein K2O01_00885, partial [Bacteroidales bacterium]|nr:hypothetical protein [Bacteroidales bacterium]
MYLIEGEAGQKVLTVQYDYTVNGDEWKYQIKAYEADGNVEFIAGDLKTGNLGEKQYRIFFGLVENANSTIPNDPLKTLNLITSGNAHKVGFNQTAADGWDKFTAYATSSIGNGLIIDAANIPQSGRTLTFVAPNACAEKATPIAAASYSITANTITKTSFNGKISFSQLPKEELAATGTIVAVLSKSEIPDYTLTNGTWHQAGAVLSKTGSYILSNAKPGYNANATSPSFNDVTLSADGLTAGTNYYIHIYTMDYKCMGAPIYSELCGTYAFTSSIDLPAKLSAGLPTTTAVPVTVQSAGQGFGVVLLKSPNSNAVSLSGKLAAGDKIGAAEVLTVIASDAETRFDAPFEAGEGAYILAVSATGLDSESPVYAADFLSIPVRAAYDGLPEFDDFSKETFYYASPKEYKRLPFGWSRETEFPEDERSRAFGLGRINDGDAICLVSSYPSTTLWADVVTPAFVCPKNKIQVTFHTSYLKNAQVGDAGLHTPAANDLVRIEYSINGGAWEEALALNGADNGFPQLNGQGQYPLSASIAKIPAGATLRLRYSYQSPNGETTVHNRIHAVTIVDGKECETPHAALFVDSLATTGSLTLRWLDNNYPQAANFVIAYRKAAEDENAWKYRRIRANENGALGTPIDGTIPELDAQTLYTAKVAAVCGTRDTSFFTEPTTGRTAFGLPYEESMAQTGSGNTA